MRIAWICAVGGSLIVWATWATAEERVPAYDVPAGLEVYTDIKAVTESAQRVIELLSVATLTLQPYPVPFKVGERQTINREIIPECDTDRIRSFNRGYQLALTGYNLLLSLRETGIARARGPHGLPDARKRRFIEFGRSALILAWQPSRVQEVLTILDSLSALPQSRRDDLATFLTILLEYRIHYMRLKARSEEQVNELFRREDHAYYWYRVYLDRFSNGVAQKEIRSDLRQLSEPIGPDELSGALDSMLRETSDVDKTDPHACFVEHYGPVIEIPVEKLQRENAELYPTKYMVSFWRRRDMEGTSTIASFVLTRVLEALRAS
ncbi:MAG: hypothetical protein AB7U75_17205 [Hyphomicrobiaceae bacterium]